MKIALILVLFSSSVIGALGNTDEVESVSVMEGDSVTLHTGATKIQGSDSIEWRFNGTRMARIKSDSIRPDELFRDTMELNNQTGDLKITNVRTTDSGLYKLNIKRSSGSSEMTFSVTVVISGLKSVSVMERDSATLNSGLTEIQGDDVIRWSFGKTIIAEIIKADQRFSPDGRFRGRLELDKKTGSLNITDTRIKDSGEYKVEISSSRFTILKRISVIVNELESVSVTERDSATLNSGLTEIQRDDEIRWSFRKTSIAEIIKADQRFPTDDGVLNGRFRGRLELDKKTGSLNITDTRIEDSGEYEVKISSSRFTILKRISVTVNERVTVLVMEGDSVTLHTASEIPRDNAVRWFGDKSARITPLTGSVDPRWSNTDQNDQTGDLTIRNIRRDQSGDYKVIFMNIQMLSMRIHRKFHINITGVNADPVKKVLGTVGGFVTLKTEKQSDEVMKWRFGSQNTLIAELKEPADSFTVYDDVLEGRFRDRLKLDNQTGSLNITDIRTTDSGVYEAGIRGNGSGYTILKTFNVTVIDVKSMSVMEGDSVPLPTGLTHIQRDDVILWRFGDQDIIIARLNGPDVYQTWSNVHLNYQTGDLNISNIRGDQFGDYKVEINTINMISHRKYNISETVNLVLVMEGDSVTLHTGVTKIQRDDAVLWYGDKGARITPSPGSVDARWKNTDQNDQTGDLTIKNIRRDQSGDYKVNFMTVSGESKHRKFHLNIIGVNADPVKKVLGTVGGFVILKTKKQSSDEVMQWRFGSQNTVIAELKEPADRFTVYDDVLDGRFRDRLELDDQTGSLTITDIRTTDSGVYEAGIRGNGSGYTIHKTFSVTVTGLSTGALHLGLSTGIVVPVVLLVFAAVVIYCCCKRSKTGTHSARNWYSLIRMNKH